MTKFDLSKLVTRDKSINSTITLTTRVGLELEKAFRIYNNYIMAYLALNDVSFSDIDLEQLTAHDSASIRFIEYLDKLKASQAVKH